MSVCNLYIQYCVVYVLSSILQCMHACVCNHKVYVYFCRQVGVLAVPVTVLVGNAPSVSLQKLYSTRRRIIVA